MITQVTIAENQNPYDIAINYYGSVEGIVWLREDNPTMILDHELVPGQTINIRDEVIDATVVQYLKDNKKTVSTGTLVLPPVTPPSDLTVTLNWD